MVKECKKYNEFEVSNESIELGKVPGEIPASMGVQSPKLRKKSSVSVSNKGLGEEHNQAACAGDFRWIETADEVVKKTMVEAEKDLARRFWLRWRRERRYEITTKKRSRNGLPVRAKTTSMEPPWGAKTVEDECLVEDKLVMDKMEGWTKEDVEASPHTMWWPPKT